MYDIDNKKIPTDKELTVEEAKNLIEHYKELAEKEESNHKKGVYNTYIRNLNSWLFKYYLNNPQIIEELIKNTDKDVINSAIEEISEGLSNDTTTKERITEEIQRAISENNESSTNEESGDDVSGERNESSLSEEGTVSESDILGSRKSVNTSMDEYVDFEEIKE